MKRTKIATIAIVAMVCLTAAGCSAVTAPPDAGLEELTIAIPQEPSNFDPVISTEVPATEPIRNVLETLLSQNSEGAPVPLLAESFEQASDNMSITFQLRQDVKFHDGSVMSADDVVASMSRWLQYSSAAKSSFEGASFAKLSDTEVVMRFATPNSAAALILSYGESSIPYVTKAKIANAAASQPISDYVGTGPFKFVAWNKGENIQLSRFEEYSPASGEADGLAGDRSASYDRLTYEFTPDPSTMVAGLQSGRYDVAEIVPFDNYAQLSSDPSLELSLTEKTSLPNLYFNKKQGIFAEVEARQALAVGLDREAMLRATYSDPSFYDAANGCMLPSSLAAQWPCDESNRPGKPDPAAAKELLAEAGYDGETIRIITSKDAGRAYPLSTVLQQQLKNLGIDAVLETYDYATLNSKRTDPGLWELIVINNIAKVEPLQQFYIPPTNPGWTEYSTLAPIIEAYQGASNPMIRKQVYVSQLQEWFTSYVPVVNIGSAGELYAIKDGLSGIESVGSTLVVWKATFS